MEAEREAEYPCRDRDSFTCKQILRRIGPRAHQPGEQILLHDQKCARAGLKPDDIFEIDAGVRYRVSGAETRLEPGLRHVERLHA